MIRIVLADDHALCRAGLRAILEEMHEVEVVAEVSDGQEALRVIEGLKPDLALVDSSLPGLNGLEVAARVSRGVGGTRTIILSTFIDDDSIRRALVGGASGYLLNSSDRSELEMAVRSVAAGNTWLAPEVSKRIAAAYRGEGGPEMHDPVEPLTPRQREVLQLVAEGFSTKEIARRLHLSTKTVESHRSDLMQRLDIHGIAGLVRYAIRVGIVALGS
jgi:DNA-binding NarL/FixJ family response regulator